MAIEQGMLAGDWDVYSNGVHSNLNLMPAGMFTHMLWGGVQGYWGHWSIVQAPEGSVLQLDLAGAHPDFFPGPNGPQPMQWPSQELWLITSFFGNQITTTDSVLVRQMQPPMMYPGFAPPSFPPPASVAMPQWQAAAPPYYSQPMPAPMQRVQPAAAAQPTPEPAHPVAARPVQVATPAGDAVEGESIPNDEPDTPPLPSSSTAPLQAHGAPTQPQHPAMAPSPADQIAAAQAAAAALATQRQIATIYSNMAMDNVRTTNSINSQWAALNTARIGVIQQQNLATMEQTHQFAQQFTKFAAS